MVLLSVEQVGGIACHTGRERCFFRRLEDGAWAETDPVLKDPGEIYRRSRTREPAMIDPSILQRLAQTLESRKGADPELVLCQRSCSPGPRRDPQEDRGGGGRDAAGGQGR